MKSATGITGAELSVPEQTIAQQTELWNIDRFVPCAQPSKNDAAVDRMCSSIREFGFKIPVLAVVMAAS
jgi:hypothetical protein